jgi:hypothetical protein
MKQSAKTMEQNKEQTETNWTPQNGEEVWMKVFSNWSLGTYVGFDTVKNVHLSRQSDQAGGYILASKDLLPYSAMPNIVKKQTAVMSLLKELYGENWSTNVVAQDFANKYLEMEKGQIRNAYNQGVKEKEGLRSGTIYYNQTYGQ